MAERLGWRSPAAGALAALAWVGAFAALANAQGWGGLRLSWLILTALLGGGAALVAWLASGPDPRRALLVLGAALVGAVVVPALTHSAPPTSWRIAERLDDAHLPGRVVGEKRIGNTRCKPLCPQLERTYVITGISYAKASSEVRGLLRAARFEAVSLPPASRRAELINVRTGRIRCLATLADVAPAESRLTFSCQSRKG